MEILRRYHDGDILVVSSTPDNIRYIDEVGIIGETPVVGARGLQRGNIRRLPGPLGRLPPGARVRPLRRLPLP